MFVLQGCATSNPSRTTFMVTEAPWKDHDGVVLTSDHWQIATTVPDASRRKVIASTLESAFDAYRAFVPSTPGHGPVLKAYMFDQRQEWAQFTVENIPAKSADLYLQILRGGYAHDDFFVAYDIAKLDTLTIIAHEGWHVFARRHFKRPLPPFIEEGLAASFESVSLNGERAAISVDQTNAALERRLAAVVARDQLMTLSTALNDSASSLLDRGIDPEGFYAQGWALIRFLRNGENQRYREPFAQMLADRVLGNGRTSSIDDPVKLLEAVTGRSITELDRQYRKFVEQLVKRS